MRTSTLEELITEIKRLPDDAPLYVLMCDRILSYDEKDIIRKIWQERFPKKEVVVTEGGMTIDALTDEDLARLGLRRIQ